MKQAVSYLPDEIVIEERVAKDRYTQRILSRLPDTPIKIISSTDPIRLQVASKRSFLKNSKNRVLFGVLVVGK